jgi:hypothetical protein
MRQFEDTCISSQYTFMSKYSCFHNDYGSFMWTRAKLTMVSAGFAIEPSPLYVVDLFACFRLFLYRLSE